MFFLIGKNHPYYVDLDKNSNQNFVNKQIEALEIQLKKKYERVQDFDPEDCYNYSQNSDEVDIENSVISSAGSDLKIEQLEESLHKKFTHDTYGTSVQMQIKKLNYLNDKKSFYRKLMKLSDILAVILIILGAILSQYEHELYYYDNIFYRVTAVVMLNYAYNNPSNHSLQYMFDDKLVNLTDLTWNVNTYLENENINKSNINWKGSITTNSYFISNLDMSKFNYIDKVTDYENINVPLRISSPSNNLRAILLILTVTSCVLITMSRFFEHTREYYYKKELDKSFYKSKYFFLAILENLVIVPVQYPGLNGYIIFTQLGSTICLPLTSLLSSISIFRFIFILKLLRHYSVWNSEMAETKCERYVCQADLKFAMKAIHKEFPFLTLVLIFILTCVCFGSSLRNFELHYWEAQSGLGQNWRYHWNAMWCVFVSMTTVGYGDFYPKTHPGRIIIIIACIIGIYFVCMMMVFMTQKSILNESEQKAYNLITRLKLREEIKNIYSNIVYHYLKMVSLKKKKTKSLLNDKEYEIKLKYETRSIINYIDDKKQQEKALKHFEFIPTKDKFFDICTRIDTDIKEIKQEINSLTYINDSLISYTESQVDIIKYLKKNIYATKLIYETLGNKASYLGLFGNLNQNNLQQLNSNQFDSNNVNIYENSDSSKKNLFDSEIKKNEYIIAINNEEKKIVKEAVEIYNINESPPIKNIAEDLCHPYTTNFKYSMTNFNNKKLELNNIINPNQFDENINKSNFLSTDLKNKRDCSDDENNYENYAGEISNYNVTPEEIKEHFFFLFFIQNNQKIRKKNTMKSILIIKKMKKNHSRLKKYIDLKKITRTPKRRTITSINFSEK